MQTQLAVVGTLGTAFVDRSPLSTVFIVDDDPAARESLERSIQGAGWQVESFDSAAQFLARRPGTEPACLIVDTDGLELQQALADRPEIPVIFVTRHRDIAMSVRAMKAGAEDFLTKPCSNTALWNAVGSALERSRRALAQTSALCSLKRRYSSLSPREREVLSLVVSGKLNKQVGAVLGISEITVKAHRGSVMRKMAAASFADLVNMARALQPG
jgi:FixJ family two-component response regulator